MSGLLLTLIISGGFVFASPAYGATYYVSNELGNDSRTSVQAQSSSTPWKNHPDSNLATGNSVAMKTNFAPGDKIILRKGETWWDTQLTSGKAGTGSADDQLITTTVEDGFDTGTGAKPIISGAVLLNGSWTDTGINGEYKISLPTQSYVVYNGDTELVSGTPGSLASNGFGWVASELYVRIGTGDPAGGNIQASQRTALVTNSHYRAYKNIDFRYSNSSSQGAIYSVSATGIILDNNVVSRGRNYAIRFYDETDAIVSNNTVIGRLNASASAYSIYISNGNTRGVIYGNNISVLGTAPDNTGIRTGSFMSIYLNNISGSGLGISVGGDNNNIYNNNFSLWNNLEYSGGGGGGGVAISGSASGNIIKENYFHDGYVDLKLNETSGSGGNSIINNIFRDYHVNGICVGTGGTTANPDLVANNIFIHNPTAGNPSGSVGHGIVFSAMAVHNAELTHANVKNNLFVGETAEAEMVSIDAGILLYPNNMDKIDMDYNYFWQRDAGSAWRRFNLSGDTTNFDTWVADQVALNVTGANLHSISVLSTGSSPFIDIDANNFLAVQSSPAIDAGTGVGLTTDYAGNSLYGLPDIGAYEYQPPFTFASNHLPITGSARLYSDGKYRMTTASTTDTLADFSVTPVDGYLATTTQYLDLAINTWDTTGDQNKKWTATSTAGDFKTLATSTLYTIGDLVPNVNYTFKLDGSASTTAITNNSQCTNGVCMADATGHISFTYVGGYSTHTFELEKVPDVVPTPEAPASHSSSNTVQSQIANLLAMGNTQLAEELRLKYNMASSSPASSTPNSSSTPTFKFTRDLKLRTTHPEVKLLQHYLNTHGYPVAQTGPGSLNHETSYFGSLTKQALIKFQLAHQIKPAKGYFGPVTRKVISKL